MKMTIRKLAELAGVSRGTVDKVVHGRPGVSDPVREKVLALLEEYQYAPRHKPPEPADPAAQKVLAVLMPRLTNPFFANLRRGMEDTCAQMQNRRVRMEYFDCDEANIPEMLNILSYLEERGVDGIAMRGVQSSRIRDKLNAFAAARVPVLLFDSDVIGAERLCIVGEDSRRTGRLAASLLAKSIGGAGEVAVVGGSPAVAVHRFRIQGFQELIREKYPQIRIVEVVNSFDLQRGRLPGRYRAGADGLQGGPHQDGQLQFYARCRRTHQAGHHRVHDRPVALPAGGARGAAAGRLCAFRQAARRALCGDAGLYRRG